MVNGAAAPQAQANNRGGVGFNWKGMIVQALIFYALYAYFIKKPTTEVPLNDPITGKPLPPHRPSYKGGELLDMYVYTSEGDNPPNFNDLKSLIWLERGLSFDWNPKNEREKDIKITPSEDVILRNVSLTAHIFFVRSGKSPDPSSSKYQKSTTIVAHKQLTRYLKPPTLKGRKNLISGELEDDPEVSLKLQNLTQLTVSFWNPNLTLHLVDDFTTYPRGSVPVQIAPFIVFDTQGNNYFPMVFFNDFWIRREHLHLINETTPVLNLTLSYNTISLWKFQMMVQMQESFEMQEKLGGQDHETDNIKEMLFETNPYLLGITLAVSLLHSVFDFLAFKNDIAFWKNRKSMEGLSIRSIFVNVFLQLIIFLYLLDNDTSWIILISTGIGILIEAWKITKAVDITVSMPGTPGNPTGTFPKITWADKNSYSKETKEHDATAMRYLSYVLYPLAIGYAIYSLMYNTHKSWYSWVLGSLTGCIYTFGFVMMTPQLFINYKLKSVAHMPWKTFMYKALNTFIDDLFAFVIKMPTLHRVACFRDDLIFLVFLYQRWIYPVDPTRINEFGQGGTEEVEEVPGSAQVADTQTTETKKDQ